MTLVGIDCPHCKKPLSIILEAIDKQNYECFKCGGKFTVESSITIIKGAEPK